MAPAICGFPIYFGNPDTGHGVALLTTYHIVDALSVHVAVIAGDDVVVNHPAIYGCPGMCPWIRLIVRDPIFGNKLTPLVDCILGYDPMRCNFGMRKDVGKQRQERESPSMEDFFFHSGFKFGVRRSERWLP